MEGGTSGYPMQLAYMSIHDGEVTTVNTLTITIIEGKDGKVTAHYLDETGSGTNVDEALSGLFYRLSIRY